MTAALAIITAAALAYAWRSRRSERRAWAAVCDLADDAVVARDLRELLGVERGQEAEAVAMLVGALVSQQAEVVAYRELMCVDERTVH